MRKAVPAALEEKGVKLNLQLATLQDCAFFALRRKIYNALDSEAVRNCNFYHLQGLVELFKLSAAITTNIHTIKHN